MTTPPLFPIPKRLFTLYLKEVEGLNKPHRQQVANITEKIAADMGDPEQLTHDDLDEVGAPDTWHEALTYYQTFAAEFLPVVRHRKGVKLNFTRLAKRYGLSTNQVKKIFAHYLTDTKQKRVDFVGMNGYLVTYTLPRTEMALFEEYLKREANKELRRARTYTEFLEDTNPVENATNI